SGNKPERLPADALLGLSRHRAGQVRPSGVLGLMDINILETQVRARRRELDALAGEARSVLTRGKAIKGEIATLTEEIEDFERVTGLLNSLGEERQLTAQRTIEDLVTRGLQTIFDNTLSFHIVQSVKGKQAVVEFMVRTTLPGSVVETPVLEAR